MSDLSEKVINKLLERNSDLEYEVERLQTIIDKATDHVLKGRYGDNIDYKMHLTELYNILQENGKNNAKNSKKV